MEELPNNDIYRLAAYVLIGLEGWLLLVKVIFSLF
jgi:hypothetical protein